MYGIVHRYAANAAAVEPETDRGNHSAVDDERGRLDPNNYGRCSKSRH